MRLIIVSQTTALSIAPSHITEARDSADHSKSCRFVHPRMMRLPSCSVSSFLLSSLWMILLLCPCSDSVSLPPTSRNRDPPCTGSFDWLNPKFDSSDCVAAMNKFYRLDVARHGARDFEFVGTSGIYKTKLPKMRTPRRYTVGRLLNPNTPAQRYGTDWRGFS